MSVGCFPDHAPATAYRAERAASSLARGSDGVEEACQHLRLVIEQIGLGAQ
jgi:hypothetical protein